jgi:hypothetical protein
MTLRPGILRQPADEKGQPDGSAVTGKTRQPRVAEYDLVSQDAADHNQIKGKGFNKILNQIKLNPIQLMEHENVKLVDELEKASGIRNVLL